MSEEEDLMNEPVAEGECRRIFVPEIDQILWRKIDEESGTTIYLVKYKDRSYLHTEWLNEIRVTIHLYKQILNEKNGK